MYVVTLRDHPVHGVHMTRYVQCSKTENGVRRPEDVGPEEIHQPMCEIKHDSFTIPNIYLFK
jgi:hypothetical protein